MHRRGPAWQPPVHPVPPMPPVQPMRPMYLGRPVYAGRRPPYRHPYRHPYRRSAWTVVRYVPPPVLLVVGLVGISFLMTAMTVVIGVALLVGMVAAPVLIARSVSRSTRQFPTYHRLAPPRGPMLTAPPPRPPIEVWRHAKHRFATLRSEYAAYECDALAVLRLPALADVTVPSTARFVEAFAEAQALDVDSPPPPGLRDQYVAAVDRACRAWQAAREAAERIRLSHLPPDERATVERVVRLLVTARDTDNDAERLVAYGKARSELARLERIGHVRIPRPAQAQLDNAYRGQLPA